jgi:hypothetical protein
MFPELRQLDTATPEWHSMLIALVFKPIGRRRLAVQRRIAHSAYDRGIIIMSEAMTLPRAMMVGNFGGTGAFGSTRSGTLIAPPLLRARRSAADSASNKPGYEPFSPDARNASIVYGLSY